MMGLHDLGWDAARHRRGRYIVNDASARADYRARADSNPWDSACTHAEKSQTTDFHVSRQRASRTEVRAFADRCIVIDHGAGVDNRKIADRRCGVHHCAGHNRDATAKLRGRGDDGSRADCIDYFKTETFEVAPDR